MLPPNNIPNDATAHQRSRTFYHKSRDGHNRYHHQRVPRDGGPSQVNSSFPVQHEKKPVQQDKRLVQHEKRPVQQDKRLVHQHHHKAHPVPKKYNHHHKNQYFHQSSASPKQVIAPKAGADDDWGVWDNHLGDKLMEDARKEAKAARKLRKEEEEKCVEPSESILQQFERLKIAYKPENPRGPAPFSKKRTVHLSEVNDFVSKIIVEIKNLLLMQLYCEQYLRIFGKSIVISKRVAGGVLLNRNSVLREYKLYKDKCVDKLKALNFVPDWFIDLLFVDHAWRLYAPLY